MKTVYKAAKTRYNKIRNGEKIESLKGERKENENGN